MTNKILTLTSEFTDLRSKWKTLSIYERFEQTVVSVLTLVIAVIIALATWQLLLHTLSLVETHAVNPADPQGFQGLFGMVLTVLISLEFKHTLLVVRHHRRAIVQVRAVVLIALLALVRRFIILESLPDHSECGRSPGRIHFGPGGRVLAGQQLRIPGGRCVAGPIFTIRGSRRGKEQTQPYDLFSPVKASTKGEIMNNAKQGLRTRIAQQCVTTGCLILIFAVSPIVSFAQPATPPPPAPLSSSQLDQLVARIALYPDPLLAQVLTASTYWSEIPDAARWADEHSYLKGDALAQAIQADHLQWDPSILGLLAFPSVLYMMASDPTWTQQLGDAVLTQRADVMDAAQRMRRKARNYGYLIPNSYCNVVDEGGYIQILPVDPSVIYMPAYDPFIVFAPPRPGFAIAGAIRFGPAITIGATFGAWGWWLGSGFAWPSHTILIDRSPWTRVWAGRIGYVHPYVHPWVRPVGPRVEVHHLHR